MQIGVHARFENRNAAKLIKFRRVSVVVKPAGDQYIEVCIAGLARGGNKIGARDCSEFRSDGNRGEFLRAELGVRFAIAALSANKIAGPRSERCEGDLVILVCLLLKIEPCSESRSRAVISLSRR